MTGTNLLHYRILEKLGAGGQGAVYKALNTKLGRNVVVKVLPRELTAKEVNLKRFEREARLASSLDHPNICAIYDLNEAEGVHFIVMQHVEGKNVRQLVGGRPLELRTALLIAVQVADALSAAHARGVIHRDIKAGNVMVTDSGQVKVLDFGLAKLLDETTAQDEGIHQTQLTEIGVPYGTATYAAPEQATGAKVDHRADIFSTGVLLYEMLTGIWPFQGKTSVDVRHAVLHAAPRPLSDYRKDAPPRLQQILDRAMSKQPEDRYQKISELRDDLRAVLQEIAAGTVESLPGAGLESFKPQHLGGRSPVARALRWLRTLSGKEQTTRTAGASTHSSSSEVHMTPLTSMGAHREKKSIAILPFRNLNNDAASAFYEFSLADAVITELAGLRSLVVRPSSVIAKYQGQPVDPRDAGRDLDVTAVLAAGFMHAGERLRVNAQLIDVASGEILWSERVDAASEDIIAVQDTIAQRIVAGLRVELSPDEQLDMARPVTHNAAAYQEYLRGRDLFARFIFRTVAPEDCDAAVSHFERAVSLDPDFALAHDGLGAAFANRVFKGFGGAADYERAEESFKRALAIDPQLVEARMLSVFVMLWRGEKQKARAEVARMRREAPNEAVVYFVKATLHRLDGEYERALRSYDRLVQLDPAAYVVAACNRALISIFEERYDEATTELEQALSAEPDNPLAQALRALACYYVGDAARAAALLRRLLAAHTNMPGIRPFLALALSAQDDHEAARAELTPQVIENASVDADAAYWLASVYALEDDREAAFDWLARAIRLGNENRAFFERDRNWARLRDDPRFAETLSQIKPVS
ncbi:MAG: protein kinase [Pyrinomonadaceae bacterium]